MKLVTIETPGIAHFAYLLADGGDAAVVDPRRDVDAYLAAARRLGVRIRYIIETHRHEDFVIGAAELADRTGAEVVNGQHDLFGHGDLRLADGASFALGSLRIEALHTPGHTPESTCYAVYVDRSDRHAWGVFTGDTLFFGDTGRTDLPDPDRSVDNAALLYEKVHARLASLGDGCQVLPAHGPGSVCGSGMLELPASTLGLEKRLNPVFTASQREFAERKGSERLPRPPQFRFMEEVNLRGGLAPSTAETPLLQVDAFADQLEGSCLIDTRKPAGFAGGHVCDAYSVWLDGLPIFGGWVTDQQSRVSLICDRDADALTARRHLSRIGIDRVDAALAGGFEAWRDSGRPVRLGAAITPRELRERRSEIRVLDVREPDEFAGGHIPGAHNIYVGHLEHDLPDWDRDETIAVTCGVGHRAGVAVSVLERAGFRDVRNLLGGMSAWASLGYTEADA